METNDMAQTPDSASSHTVQSQQALFVFKGDGMEYFKIWIVNILLTIITLGLYSPWAKVRNARYFYSHLYLDGHNFSYLADPFSIFKSRIIAFVVVILISLGAQLSPAVGIAAGIAILFLFPLLFNLSFAFENRMSAYKNIRFKFAGNYADAFSVLYLWPILGMLTLGIMYPYALLKMNKYIVSNSSYGQTLFNFNATFKDYGIIFLTMIGIGLVIGLPVWGLTAFVGQPAFATALIVPLYFGLIVYFTVATTNLFYRSLQLADHRYSSSMTMSGFSIVLLKNIFFIVITLGLYLPAAKVRMTKYLANCITMNVHGSLDDFHAAEQEKVSAFGEELGGALGLEL